MVFEKYFPYVTDAQRPECHAATIVELPSGDLLCAWYAGTREGAEDVAVLAARWESSLGRWREPDVVVDTPNQPEGNPVLFTDQWGHTWLFFVTIVEDGWAGARLKAMKSEDEGHTWSQTIVFDEPLGTMPRNKPYFLGEERVLLPLYDEATWRGFMYISDDRCQSWRRSGWIQSPSGCIQPSVYERSDGTLVALLRDRGRENVWRSQSRDGGETWSPCQATPIPNPNAATDVVLLSSGNVVLVFNDSRQRRTPLSLAWSEDEGDSWRLKLDVETDEGEFSYPAIIQDRAGRMHVVYTWKRERIAHVVLDEEWLVEHGEEYQPLQD